jgi:hypothetical protein
VLISTLCTRVADKIPFRSRLKCSPCRLIVHRPVAREGTGVRKQQQPYTIRELERLNLAVVIALDPVLTKVWTETTPRRGSGSIMATTKIRTVPGVL